jgi:hypothetical protein
MALCLLSERGFGLPLVSYEGWSHVVLHEYITSVTSGGLPSLFMTLSRHTKMPLKPLTSKCTGGI